MGYNPIPPLMQMLVDLVGFFAKLNLYFQNFDEKAVIIGMFCRIQTCRNFDNFRRITGNYHPRPTIQGLVRLLTERWVVLLDQSTSQSSDTCTRGRLLKVDGCVVCVCECVCLCVSVCGCGCVVCVCVETSPRLWVGVI